MRCTGERTVVIQRKRPPVLSIRQRQPVPLLTLERGGMRTGGVAEKPWEIDGGLPKDMEYNAEGSTVQLRVVIGLPRAIESKA